MTRHALASVVQRALTDAAFRRRLVSDPTALAGYDLTEEEREVLRGRDAARLGALGVDQRMSKAFTLDPGSIGATAAGAAGEPRDVEPFWSGGVDTAQVAGTSVDAHDIAPVDLATVHPELATGDDSSWSGAVTSDDDSATLDVHDSGADVTTSGQSIEGTSVDVGDIAPVDLPTIHPDYLTPDDSTS